MKKREILTKGNGMCADTAVSDQVCLEMVRTSAELEYKSLGRNSRSHRHTGQEPSRLPKLFQHL